MKKALFVIVPIVAALGIMALVLFPGSTKSPDEKELEGLWVGSKAIFLGEIQEIEKVPPQRKRRDVMVIYKVAAMYRGLKVETYKVDFVVPGEGPIALPAEPFAVGAKHLLFLRNESYGPAGGYCEDTFDRALPATPERIKIVEKLASPK